MIIYACLLRTVDGIPLCATNNFSKNAECKVREAKRIVKSLSKQCQNLSNKLCIQDDELTIHCIKVDSTTFIVVCEPNYPHILAYSFLDELLKEFSLLYTPSIVNSVKRPFAFIEFDSYLQKVQQKYNSTRSLASRLNLTDLTNDLNLNPPIYKNLSDFKFVNEESTNTYSLISINNGSVANGYVKTPIVIPGSNEQTKLQLKPISWYGKLALVFAFFCICLDGYRGIVSLSLFNAEDDDGPSLSHGLSFLVEIVLLSIQIICLRKCLNYRKSLSIYSFLAVVLLNVLLVDIREILVIGIYTAVSFCMLLATVNRGFEKCLPRFNV